MHKSKIRNLSRTVLSDNWYKLYKYSFEMLGTDGKWTLHHREAYDRGNGATILLYNLSSRTVVLTCQFRLPTYINGNADGLLIETCAGLLDGLSPEECIRKEAEEETGYQVSQVEKLFEAYMSPGSVTEIIHFFGAQYDDQTKRGGGGGVHEEGEHIEVLELSFDEALRLVDSNVIKDAKTIMLLQYAHRHIFIQST